MAAFLPHGHIVRGARAGRRNKYGARKTTICGITFDSHQESQDYLKLLARQQAGEITDLKTQVRYDLVVNGVRIGRYTADFTYTETATGRLVVADSKGCPSRDYILRKKLMLACHGIEIVEMRARAKPPRKSRRATCL